MGKKSNSSSSNVTNQYDQRSITTVDDRDTSYAYTDASSYAYTDASDRSLNYSNTDNSVALDINDDRDWYGYSSDSSNRSVTTIHNTGTDAGAVRLGELNAQLLGAVSEQQTDAVKAIAGFGADSIARMGESVTDLYGVAGANVSKAWEQTLDLSGGVLDKLLDGAKVNSDAARAVAQSAIASYTPTENKNADALKWGALALAAIGGVFLLRKA